MFRANAIPGHLSNISEAMSVARFHSMPPTPPGFGDSESGSSASISAAVSLDTKGRTTRKLSTAVFTDSVPALTCKKTKDLVTARDV